MYNHHQGNETDSPFTWRELLLSLGYAVAGVSAMALLVIL
jgi:hypothetical protein